MNLTFRDDSAFVYGAQGVCSVECGVFSHSVGE